MRKIEIDEFKRLSLEILLSVDKFCKENKLTYFLDCGTLIGCIRHGGFIPWDDDIDLLMPREDYETFIRTYRDEGFTVFSFRSHPRYFYQYAKVSKDGTYINEFDVPDVEGLGVNIDIFPMDGMPNALLPRRIHQDILYFFSKYRALMLRLIRTCPAPMGVLFRWKWVVRLLDGLGKRYSPKNSDYCGNIVATTIWHKEIPVSCFAAAIPGSFEGRELNIPVGYDEYLKRMYGDYMQLPPEEKRVAKHHFDAFEL